jgi:2Fe-2S ferredoxin
VVSDRHADADFEIQRDLQMILNLETRTGQALSIEGYADSVMELIRDNGVDELQALCGGQLSCATCHVYVDADAFDVLPAISDFESEMLDSSDHRRANSRLACQIPCLEALSGMQVTIAPED